MHGFLFAYISSCLILWNSYTSHIATGQRWCFHGVFTNGYPGIIYMQNQKRCRSASAG